MPANDDTLVFSTATTGMNNYTPNNDLALTGITIQIADNNAANNFTFNGGTVGLSAVGMSHSGSQVGTTTFNTNLTLGATSGIHNTSTGPNGDLEINGTIDNNGHLLNVTGGEGSAATLFDGVISDSGGLHTLDGNVFLRANNTYNGTTTVSNGVRLIVTVNGALGNATGLTQVNSGGILDFKAVNYSDTEPISLNGGSLMGTDNGQTKLAGTVTLFANSFLTTDGLANTEIQFDGPIDGTFGLTIQQGTMIFANGANSYTGETQIDAGTLRVTGAMTGGGTVYVNSDATLEGDGQVTGAVNVFSGGTIAPGLSPGTIMTGDLNLANGSTLDQEIDAPGNTAGTDYDEIQVTGTVTIGDVTIDLSGSETPSNGDEYIIIDNDAADDVILGAGAPAEGSVIGQLDGINLRIDYHAGDGNDVALFAGTNDPIITANTPAPFTGAGDGAPDQFLIKKNGNNIEITVNGTLVYDELAAKTGSIGIKGSLDDDTLTVDTSGGLILPPITFDGNGNRLAIGFGGDGEFPSGNGYDKLLVQGSTGVTTVEQTPGLDPSSGLLNYDDGAMTIDYMGLEPIVDVLAAATYTVNGTNANNAINYIEGPNSGITNLDNPGGDDTGLISVDDYETYEFANKGEVIINALAGDDVINLNNPSTPTDLTAITVNGQDPTASDKVIVNGTTGQDTITVDTFSVDGAVVTGAQPVPVTVDTAELLVLNGQGGDDNVTFTVDQGDEVDYFPSEFEDAGSLRISSNSIGPIQRRLPVDFRDLGGNGSLTIESTSAARDLRLRVRGIDFDDRFDVSSAGQVQVFRKGIGSGTGFFTTLPILTPGVDELVLIGYDGDDVFNIAAPHPFTNGIDVQGGNPGNGSDVLNLTGADATAETVVIAPDANNPSDQEITGLGEPIDVSGVERITYTGNADDDTLTVDLGDGSKTARLQNGPAPGFDELTSSVLPMIQFADLDTFEIENGSNSVATITVKTNGLDEASTFFVNGQGQETLVIEGSEAEGDDYTVSLDAGGEVQVVDNSESVTITTDQIDGANDHLVLRTLGDDDEVTVDVDGTDLINVLITYEGGGGSDLLTVQGTSSSTVDSVAYTPGSTVDAGRLFYDSNSADMTIDFTGLEPVVDLVMANTLTVDGTPADNAINYMQTPGDVTRGRVTVDNFELIDFSNKTNLIINAQAGDDVVNLNNPNVPTNLTDITVNGDDPPASDKVIIGADGHSGNDVRVVVNAIGAAEISGAGLTATGAALTVHVATIEDLVIDGSPNPPIALTVADEAGGVFTHFTHTPAAAYDAGTVNVRQGGATGTLLDVHYENLGGTGSVTIDGVDGDDTLIALATDLSEDIGISFSATDAADIQMNTHLRLFTTNVDDYEIYALAGDDNIVINGPIDIDALDTFEIFGDGPGIGTDRLTLVDPAGRASTVTIAPDGVFNQQQDITGFGETIDVSGVEQISYFGNENDDTLVVVPGEGDNTVRIDAASESSGAATDRVVSDSLPEIQFFVLDTFILDADPAAGGASGSDIVTFKIAQLGGAAPANYQMRGDATDTLVIEGNDGSLTGDDVFMVTNPAGAPSVAVSNNTLRTVTETSGNLGRLQINSLGGDDVVGVQTDAAIPSDVIGVPITFDGGGGSDELGVLGDPATAVDEVIYTPGPAVTEGRLLYQDAADAVLMTIDFVNLEPIHDAIVAANLTVNGTHEENDINYLRAADPAEGLVTVDGFEVIEFANKTNLILNGLSGGDTINVDNAFLPTGLQTVTVNAADGDDTVTLLNLPDASVTAFVTAIVNAGPGADYVDGSAILVDTDLALLGAAGNDTLIGGAGDDSISGGFGDDYLVGNSGNNTYTEIAGQGFDTIGVWGTDANDQISVNQTSATTLVSILNGDTRNDTITTAGTVERVELLARDGDDVMAVTWADALGVDATVNSLRMDVDGGPAFTRDRLGVIDDGTGDLVLQRKGELDSTGAVTIGPLNAEPLEANYKNVEFIQPVAAANGLVEVIKHDPFEFNDAQNISTHLGAAETINVDPSIDPPAGPFGLPADQDFYRVEALETGTLDFQVFFNQIPTVPSGRLGLPGAGDVNIEVRDVAGNVVANFGVNDADDNERVRIPAVQGQLYFLRVFGATGAVVNNYTITVINDPAPVPYDLELDDAISYADSGTVVTGNSNTSFRGDNSLSAVDDFYNGQTLVFTSGPLVNESVYVADYDGGTRTFTVAPSLSSTPLVGATFDIGVLDSDDTGRSQFDNVTHDVSPNIFLRLDDDILLEDLPGNPNPDTPPDEVIDIPFNPSTNPADTTPGYRVAVFIEGDPQQPGQDPQILVGFATKNGAVDGVYEFDFDNAIGGPLALTDGSHFISAKVQIIDPANPTETGFGERSVSLEIVVDAITPPVTFGFPTDTTDGIDPAETDSGVPGYPATFNDRVTNDIASGFWGVAEANSVVRVYADLNFNNTVDSNDLLLGTTVAVPADGTNQYPNGEWNLSTNIDFNDPQYFPQDGLRRLLVTGEDLAGNVSRPDILDIFIDTQGPRVNDIYIPGYQGTYNLFQPKPQVDGPTPRVDSLRIEVTDLPDRIAQFLYDALQQEVAEEVGHYVIEGDHVGVLAIVDVNVVQVSNPGLPAEATIELFFAEPMPDDRYTITISDSLVDPANNALDGESGLIGPIGTPDFPSGDGVPGGDFIGRFTIDSRDEIATWSSGSVFVDINQNYIFDPDGPNTDETNRDLVFTFGDLSSYTFAGNFAPAGAASATGFDKLGAYGFDNSAGVYRFLIDFDHDGVVDLTTNSAFQINAIPVAGDFAPGHAGDEIGLFDGSTWYLDTTGNYVLNQVIASQQVGLPFVGDFNGDGNTDLATFDAGINLFTFDADRNGTIDDSLTFGFNGFRDRPVAGDLNLDGIDDIGLFVPRGNVQISEDVSEWYFLVSDHVHDDESVSSSFVIEHNLISEDFSPDPLGNDLFFQYGNQFALPLMGNFDPPVVTTTTVEDEVALLQNPDNMYDVNHDGHVTPNDALTVINAMNADDIDEFMAGDGESMYVDVNGDGIVSPNDAIRVINQLDQDELAAAATGSSAGVMAGAVSSGATGGELAAMASAFAAPSSASPVASLTQQAPEASITVSAELTETDSLSDLAGGELASVVFAAPQSRATETASARSDSESQYATLFVSAEDTGASHLAYGLTQRWDDASRTRRDELDEALFSQSDNHLEDELEASLDSIAAEIGQNWLSGGR